jgi:hypothetical protein
VVKIYTKAVEWKIELELILDSPTFFRTGISGPFYFIDVQYLTLCF